MGCRGSRKNYRWPGICHITVNVMEGRLQPLGRIIGDASKPIVTVEDNGFPTIYHPSERRTDLCSNNKLLIITPWQYACRRANESITVAECKTMNCIVQAICRTKDSWWKG